MTFEKAKKILEKEGYNLGEQGKPGVVSGAFLKYESPEICEAMQIVCSAGYEIIMFGNAFEARKERLKKEYEENHIKCGEPIPYSPALEEAASQFNDALLDEQAKKIAEKDEVIADLGNELAATKKELEEKTKLVEVVRKGSKEYCEYGIAAEKMIRKMANVIVYEGKVSSKEFEEYRRWANGYRFNPQLYDFIEEEVKKLNAAKMVDINAMCMRAARESINDVFESYAAKYAKSSPDDLKEKAYELFNAKVHNLGLVGSKDGNGIIDQMVGTDIAEEGTDLSGVFVLCGKDFIDALKNVKDVWQE